MTNIATPKPKRNSKSEIFPKCRTLTGFLRRVTSNLMYGFRLKNGTPCPALNKHKLIQRYNERHYGEMWSVAEFEDHCLGKKTLYFFGNDDPRCPYTLVMIDIDVLKSKKLGSPEGARHLAEHYKALFPNSFWEPSTNDQGMHGYLLISKSDYTAGEVKKGMLNLQAYLRKEAEGYDVELVEVKGQPCVVAWTGREIDHLTYGQFAKLPRHATLEDMQSLEVIALWDLTHSPMFTEAKAPEADMKKEGSLSFDIIDAEGLKRLERFTTSYVCNRTLTVGKTRVMPVDFAILNAILLWKKRHPCKDGATPTKAIQFLWDELRKQGITDRAFDPQRYKVMRDYLSERGLIDVVDNRYWYRKDGKGQAMKWHISDAYEGLLSNIVEGEPSTSMKTGGDTGTDKYHRRWIECQGQGQQLIPVDATMPVRPKFWWDEYILDRLAA